MWKWIIAALGALAALSRFAWLARFIPGLGPFAAIGSAILSVLAAVVRGFFAGLTIIVTNPATLITVGFFCMAAFAGGTKTGIEWTEHRIPIAFAKGKQVGRTELAAEVNAKSAETVAAADEGRAEVLPVDKAQIAALCAKSASCRDRSRP